VSLAYGKRLRWNKAHVEFYGKSKVAGIRLRMETMRVPAGTQTAYGMAWKEGVLVPEGTILGIMNSITTNIVISN
jgi:hypothetical protein